MNSIYNRFQIVKYFLILPFCSQNLSGQDNFISVGIHPGAEAQPNSIGKQISILFPWNESLKPVLEILALNPGPLVIISLNPGHRPLNFDWRANREPFIITEQSMEEDFV